MGFREEWYAQRGRQVNGFSQQVLQARERWQGRRVWVWRTDWSAGWNLGEMRTPDWQYGVVESIDDRGLVRVLFAYDRHDQPVYCWISLDDLGRLAVLAE